MLRAFVPALVLYVAARPVLGLAHELSVAAVAVLLHQAVATDWWQPAIAVLRLDPVYAGAAVRSIGGIQVAGFAVAGPVGAWLHAVVPGLALDPGLVSPGAWVSTIATPGAPALGRVLTAFTADAIWLTIGVWLVRSQSGHRSIPAIIGLFIQGQIVVNHLFDAQVTLPDLNATGVPFALAVAMPANGWFTYSLAGLSEPLRTLVLGGTLVALGYACAAMVLLSVHAVRRLVHKRRLQPTQPSTLKQARFALAGAVVGLVTAISPVGAFALGKPSWEAAPESSTSGVLPATATNLATLLSAPSAAGPSDVQVVHERDGSWSYLVNGRPTVIRGVGYNPQYASPPADRRAELYERDFRAMRELGINTIEGWFEPQFDELTLDSAAHNGIGVLMPFELNQDWNFADPAVQADILARVSAYVEQYKDHPAIRMWAPGNEDLHRILYPHWMSQENNPPVRARADAFAAFLPILVDRIHALDPAHPVIYRDAEDVYLPRLKAAFEATGVARPWLVYGANVYSATRLRQIVDAWPSQWLDAPLVLSEFAPGGVGPAERPIGFEQDWSVIRSRPGVVLGGLAYTWATNGPEDLDRVFGLVDADGVPSDGALAALSGSYLADLQSSSSS